MIPLLKTATPCNRVVWITADIPFGESPAVIVDLAVTSGEVITAIHKVDHEEALIEVGSIGSLIIEGNR